MALERLGQQLVVGLDRAPDRQLEQLDAEVVRERLRVRPRALRRIARRHRHAGHAVRAERVDRDQQHERRVDATGQPDHDVLEAVLGHVVAGGEHERRIDLGVGVEQLGDLAADLGLRAVVGGLADGGERRHARLELARRRPLACLAQPRGRRGVRVDVAEQQVLGELRRARDHVAVVVADERVAVEDQLVLPADQRAERDRRERVRGALRDHPLAAQALADLVGRRGDVDDQRRAGERLVALGHARHPDVLADREADLHAVDLDGAAGRRPRLEVAHLVEDAVVGQMDLAVDALHRAVGQHGRRVVDVVGALREADDRDDVLGVGGDPVDRVAHGGQEVLLEQQVLGRVAADGELGEQHEACAALARGRDAVADLALVAGDVADHGVHLAERDPHCAPCPR